MKLNHTASPIPASGFDGLLTGMTAQKRHRKSALRKLSFLCGKAPVCPSWPPLVPSPLLPTHITSHHSNRVPVPPFQQVQPMGAPGRRRPREVTTGDTDSKLKSVALLKVTNVMMSADFRVRQKNGPQRQPRPTSRPCDYVTTDGKRKADHRQGRLSWIMWVGLLQLQVP